MVNHTTMDDPVREILAVSYGGGVDDDDVDDENDYDPQEDRHATATSMGTTASASRSKHDSVRRRLFMHQQPQPQDQNRYQQHHQQQQNLASSHPTTATTTTTRASHVLPTIHSPSIASKSSSTSTSASATRTEFTAYKNDPLVRRRILKITFIVVGAMFLVGVHLYLFHFAIARTSIAEDDAASGAVQPTKSSTATATNDIDVLIKPIRLPPRTLTTLRDPVDYEKYTIRINTWRRNEQLLASVAHHSTCEGVAQIQIVWCDPDNEPPSELLENPEYKDLVVVEHHTVNNLNERFHILEKTLKTTPTLGILSIDDDVLRPCEAIDNGFFKWVKSPHRMVGFDARTHVVVPAEDNDNESNNNDNNNISKEGSTTRWKYGYLSTTEKTNRYSFSLTRYCFIHRDYMTQYMNDLPDYILDTVAKNFNCEDVAMSFLISARTDGQPSLLADLWAMKSLVKLYVPEGISGTKQHKTLRDDCVEHFSKILGLRGHEESTSRDGNIDNNNNNNNENNQERHVTSYPHELQTAKFVHSNDPFFECGAREDSKKNESYSKSQRELDLSNMIESWRTSHNSQDQVKKLMSKTGFTAYKMGLIANTDKWKEKYE